MLVQITTPIYDGSTQSTVGPSRDARRCTTPIVQTIKLQINLHNWK
jgi:hypothetical protein